MMTVFGIGMIALGALFALIAWRRHRAKAAECALAASTWRRGEATIRSVGIGQRIDRDFDGDEVVTFVPEVRYAFSADGRHYEGTRAWLARDAFSSRRDADAWVAARPVGGRVPVWFDPANPAQSTLEIDRPSIVTLFAFAAVGAVFAGVGAIFLLF